MGDDSPLLKRIEIFLNEQRADLAVFHVTLQTFLVRLIAARPDRAEETLQDLKEQALGALGRMQVDPSDQRTEKAKQLAIMRGERFFLELEEALAASREMLGRTRSDDA